MAGAGRRRAPDQAQRDAAVAERRRNVLIDAGAGTGKTTILVDRLVEMIAPTTEAPAVPIERLAAITFTRKAAGELRLRIRERFLEELAAPGVVEPRAGRLREALAGLDTAYVGTIHSFADRLLRLKPVEAALSPSYEIAEDTEALVHETFETLLHAVQNDTLAGELAGTAAADRSAEATRTILFALQAGLPAGTREFEWGYVHGLESLVAGFIGQRDIPPPDAEAAPFDLAAFHAAAEEIVRLTERVRPASPGARWLAALPAALGRLRRVDVPLVLLQEITRLRQRAPRRDARKGATFEDDGAAWIAWKRIMVRDGHHETPLWDELSAPLHRWMATRLARLFPVVVALHDRVKARNQALDQLDLLARLRDVLAGDRAVRGAMHGMFDHVFVDEFQDTDPLQAEIVLFLCEREPLATRWKDVVLRDGALTLVGDPKQSIYRFRRADVAMYDRVRSLVAGGPHLRVTLSANFRSAPSLIAWLNDRFDRILGTSPDGRPFDAATGRVFQQRLAPGRQAPATAAVHVLPFELDDALKHSVNDYRKLEGQALAQYLTWLVSAGDVEIEDPVERRRRRPRYGDIAVLAISTWHLSLLFSRLDAAGIPYASRGGTLFLSDPLHRQFLLGLRAVADRDDGVAEAALLRPPFFALDLVDLLRARRAAGGPDDESTARVSEARDLVRALRQERFARPPGATARDLLDRTAFARTVALGPNGAQRLARLRELCLLLEQTAADEGLDYDAATARLRDWVDAPVQVDPPHPVGTEAVNVLTVHQAKGLEFPVVVLWDGKASWNARLDIAAWRMERDGHGWTMNLKDLAWEEPPGLDLRGTERQYLEAERRRVVYVAATRARDLLVVPCAGSVAAGRMICGDLLEGTDPALVRRLDLYRPGSGAPWVAPPAAAPAPADATGPEHESAEHWHRSCADAARPRFAPAGVGATAHDAVERDGAEPLARRPRPGRFGDVFGSTVHLAIGAVLREPALDAGSAVERAARLTGLTAHLDEARADVERTVTALRAEGLAGPVGPSLQLEYPIAGPWEGGRLLSGYIDLLAATGPRLVVIDFKTDAPPAGRLHESYPEYVRQVEAYATLLQRAGVPGDGAARCGLLFTADGGIRWVGTV